VEITLADAIQVLVSSGHSWADIQRYTIDQITLFGESAVKMENLSRLNMIHDMFAAFRATKESFNDHIASLKPKEELGVEEFLES
jgi:hypothetical protein